MVDVAERPPDTRRRIAAYLPVGVLAMVLSALSFRTLDVPVPVGAANGLAWTLLAILVATYVNRRRDRLGHWPDTIALVAAANDPVHGR
jgi:cation transporter-like permease